MKYWVHLDTDVYISEVNEINEFISKEFKTMKEAESYADKLCLAIAKGDKLGKNDLSKVRSQLCDKLAMEWGNAVTINISTFNEGGWVDNKCHSIVCGNL